MPLTQTGATYKFQPELQRRDRALGGALDDIASQIEAVRQQGNFGVSGSPSPPHPVMAIQVSAKNGFATVQLTHNSAPAGSNYVIEYSETPTFQSPIRVDNGISLSYQNYLKGQTLYWRTATKFITSGLAQWTYFGGQANPTPVSF